MAVFTINIDSENPPFYSGITDITNVGLDPFYQAFTVGLDSLGSNIADKFLVTSVDRVNHTQKLLHLSILIENESFFLEYNGIRLFRDDSEITIDISSIGLGDPIPGLLLKFVDYQETVLGRIYVKINVTDTLDVRGGSVYSYYYAQNDNQNI